MKFRGWFPDMYPDWKSRFTEILIEASTALYRDEFEGKGHAQRGLSKLKSQHGIHLSIDPVEIELRTPPPAPPPKSIGVPEGYDA